MNKEQSQRVGVLVVHGIGEQKPNEHRDEVAKSLIRVWRKIYGARVVETSDSPEHREECIKVLLGANKNLNQSVEIEISEVYWADADENPQGSWEGMVHQLAFWRWGLSQWAVKRFAKNETELPGSKDMLSPIPPGELKIPLLVRLKLLGVGIVFALLGVTWELLWFLALRLRVVTARSGILVQYLGDVALYTENSYRYRPEKVAFTDAPRDAIRRRMVRGLIDMAGRKYDRWYILAHSLGTVVAHNGLMELAEALPNYIDRAGWNGINNGVQLSESTHSMSNRKMRPPRPPWLTDTDAIDRTALFKQLKGFCTYGSPLDKFATLWPAIVPINKDSKPLRECEWINVFDRMDPVAGQIDRFDQCDDFAPRNIPYKSSWAFLFAHTFYLNVKSGQIGFAERLADWILTGNNFEVKPSRRFGGGKGRAVVRCLCWFVLAGIPLSLLSWLLAKSCVGCVESVGEIFVSFSAALALLAVLRPDAGEIWAAVCVLLVTLALVIAMPLARRRDS